MDLHPGRGRFRSPVGPHAPTQIPVSDFRLRKVGIARYDLRDPYYAAVTAPWRAFLPAVAALILLLNLLFASLYLLRPGEVQNLPRNGFADSFADAFFFSMETMSTVGYGAMAPASLLGHAVATGEMVVGLGFTASLTGILFVRLSRPRARILFADQAVVNGSGGDGVLSIRVANGRQVPLINATASLAALFVSGTREGAPVWELHQLTLEENQTSMFPLIWTLDHRLSAGSPLAGIDPALFGEHRLRLFLMVGAHDPAISADVQELREYEADALVFGRRYAEALSRDADGRVLADLARLSELA